MSGEGLGVLCLLADVLISVLIEMFVFICSVSKSCTATETVSLEVGGVG